MSFLDKNGLARLWANILALVDTKVDKLQTLVGNESVESQITSAMSDVVTVDTDGAIAGVANTINADTVGGLTLSDIMLKLYPVGAIYTSTVSTNPSTLFGGTWEQIQGKFLLAAGSAEDTYGETVSTTAGETGGYKQTAHVMYRPPINSHQEQVGGNNWLAKMIESANAWLKSRGSSSLTSQSSVHNLGGAISTQGTTGTEVGYFQYLSNNMPPYLAVYVWKRTA